MKSKFIISKNDLTSIDRLNTEKRSTKNINKLKFRSTFHKAMTGKFLDLPPLNDKQHKRKNFDPSNCIPTYDLPIVPRSCTNVIPIQPGSGSYSRRNMLPDVIPSSQSKERPSNRGRPN